MNEVFNFTYLCDGERHCGGSAVCKEDCIRTTDEKHAVFTKNGNSAIIKCHILDRDKMKQFGFTDKRKGYWYKCIVLPPPVNHISFNITISRQDPEDWSIDILDENFCQPYDYQHFVSKYPVEEFPSAWMVKHLVDGIMNMYSVAGLISGWQEDDYI